MRKDRRRLDPPIPERPNGCSPTSPNSRDDPVLPAQVPLQGGAWPADPCGRYRILYQISDTAREVLVLGVRTRQGIYKC